MSSLRWTVGFVWWFGFLPVEVASGAAPAARWVGQDGKDFVGGEPGPKPSGYQDVHLSLSGLPPGRNLAEVTLQGHGHGAWSSGVSGRAAVHVVRGEQPGAFDLYLEPYQAETGREFELKWRLDDGQAGSVYFAGGVADPNRRVAGLGIEAQWVVSALGVNAPPPVDRAGLDGGVGPDGFADAQVRLTKLPRGAEIREVAVAVAVAPTGQPARTWRSGLNPTGGPGAEFLRHPTNPTQGDLFFAPSPDLTERQTLSLSVTYGDGRTDSASLVVGRLPSPRPIAVPRLGNLAESRAKARWVGQADVPVRGAARVSVEGWPASRGVVAAALSDGVISTWLYRRADSVPFQAGPETLPLLIEPRPGGRLNLAFVPTRDETGATLTLRLRDERGREELIRFPGGPVDLLRLAPPLPGGALSAQPGDDLAALLGRAEGTVTLKPGEYRLRQPLDLPHAIRLVGPGATLVFDPPGDGPPWVAALKIHEGNTTLEGFAVRFAGPGRWDWSADHGPSVVRVVRPEKKDGPEPHRHAVALIGLDLQGPPSRSNWEEAIPLANLLAASSGRVENSRLKGGSLHLDGGPWAITGNDFQGTVPNTFNRGVFGVVYGHDLTLTRNRAHDVGPSGKTWRFLVLSQRGANDLIADNVVEGGIGPRADDPHPHDNSPEVILTEAYRLRFEGRPLVVSPDGRLIAIPEPPGGVASAGDSLAILAGPEAGQWRSIAQVLGPRLYLLDAPIRPEVPAVSVATGFVRESFLRNTIDCRGSAQAANLVLAGNLFGVQVVGNRFLGGGETVRLHASPTEAPVHWGWSHAPILGMTFADNLVEDSVGIGAFGVAVEHGPAIRTNRGRVYLSLTLRSNTFRWTDAALAARVKLDPSGATPGPRFQIGATPTLDPAELSLTEQGTRVEGAPPAAVWINGATVNGTLTRDRPLVPQP